MTVPQFRRLIWEHGKKHGRHSLPWRKQKATPYAILVSEIMLQQTQVDRVIPYYHSFLKQFPTVRALAKASLADVLNAWQGLGYNRRGKMLHEAAKQLVALHKGNVPNNVQELEALPGIGPYTARAIAAFAYNEDTVFIETNLRTAVIHHFFSTQEKVSDDELLTVLAKALPKGRARAWYAALMDYGAHLKRSGIRTNHRSTTYAKQKTFKGSDREARGMILKATLHGPQSLQKLEKLLGPERSDQMNAVLARLVRDGMLQKQGRAYSVPTSDHQSSAHSKGQRGRSRHQ